MNNPHPVLNGDVIELAAQIIDPLAFSGLPDGDTVSFTQNIAWRKTEARKRAQSLASAGLLKLSEGSETHTPYSTGHLGTAERIADFIHDCINETEGGLNGLTVDDVKRIAEIVASAEGSGDGKDKNENK